MNNKTWAEMPESTIDITFRNLDEEDASAITNWRNYWLSLWELDQWLRQKVKYDLNIDDLEVEAYDRVRKTIRNIMDEHGCSLDDLS